MQFDGLLDEADLMAAWGFPVSAEADHREPLPQRKRYYNPMLDPHCQQRMSGKMLECVEDYETGGPLHEPDEDHPANLVSSLCDDGWHRPALDIDVPCTVVASSTPGHCHLYFPTLALSWNQYTRLLNALADCGILEQGYVDHSMEREQTLLRPPGVTKQTRRKGPHDYEIPAAGFGMDDF